MSTLLDPGLFHKITARRLTSAVLSIQIQLMSVTGKEEKAQMEEIMVETVMGMEDENNIPQEEEEEVQEVTQTIKLTKVGQ